MLRSDSDLSHLEPYDFGESDYGDLDHLEPYTADDYHRAELEEAPEDGSFFKDAMVSVLKGVVQTGESAVGMADIVTLGLAGKLLQEGLGYDPKTTHGYLEKLYSAKQQLANMRVDDAEGFWGTVKAMVENPSTIAHSLIETAPLIGLSGGIARQAIKKGLLAKGSLFAPALGEGAVSAGAMAEGTRQQTETGDLNLKQASLAGASGLVTGAFNLAGGRLAKKLRFADPDSWAAGLGFKDGINGLSSRIGARIVAGGISEGVFEELPQEVADQIFQNAALGKPLMEGTREAAGQATVVGTAMGGGINIFKGGVPAGKPEPKPGQQPGKQPADQPPAGRAGAMADIERIQAKFAPQQEPALKGLRQIAPMLQRSMDEDARREEADALLREEEIRLPEQDRLRAETMADTVEQGREYLEPRRALDYDRDLQQGFKLVGEPKTQPRGVRLDKPTGEPQPRGGQRIAPQRAKKARVDDFVQQVLSGKTIDDEESLRFFVENQAEIENQLQQAQGGDVAGAPTEGDVGDVDGIGGVPAPPVGEKPPVGEIAQRGAGLRQAPTRTTPMTTPAPGGADVAVDGVERVDFDEMVGEARRWKGAAIKADAVYGDDKRARLKHSNMTTKGDLDAYLKKRFGLNDTDARQVSNELTREDLEPDEAANIEDFKGEPWADAALKRKEPVEPPKVTPEREAEEAAVEPEEAEAAAKDRAAKPATPEAGVDIDRKISEIVTAEDDSVLTRLYRNTAMDPDGEFTPGMTNREALEDSLESKGISKREIDQWISQLNEGAETAAQKKLSSPIGILSQQSKAASQSFVNLTDEDSATIEAAISAGVVSKETRPNGKTYYKRTGDIEAWLASKEPESEVGGEEAKPATTEAETQPDSGRTPTEQSRAGESAMPPQQTSVKTGKKPSEKELEDQLVAAGLMRELDRGKSQYAFRFRKIIPSKRWISLSDLKRRMWGANAQLQDSLLIAIRDWTDAGILEMRRTRADEELFAWPGTDPLPATTEPSKEPEAGSKPVVPEKAKPEIQMAQPKDTIKFTRGGREWAEMVLKVWGEGNGDISNTYEVKQFGTPKYIRFDEVTAVKPWQMKPIGEKPDRAEGKKTGAVPSEIEIKGGKTKTVSVDIPKKEANALSPTEQKSYLLAEIDKAIEDQAKELAGDGFMSIEAAKYQVENPKEVGEFTGKTYTFEVPGDGKFRISGGALSEFRNNVQKKFPGSLRNANTPKSTAGKINYGAQAKSFSKLVPNPKTLKAGDVETLLSEVAEKDLKKYKVAKSSGNDYGAGGLVNNFRNWLLSQPISGDVRNKIKETRDKDYYWDAAQKVKTDYPHIGMHAPLFSRRATARHGTMTSNDVRKTVRTETSAWENAPEIKVLETQDELPQKILDAVPEGQIVDGVHHEGTVYLVAENLKDSDQVIKTLAHEAFGHYGIREVMESDANRFFHQVWKDNVEAVEAVAKEYDFDTKRYMGRVLAADEWLAREAAKNPDSGLMDQLIRMVREWARKVFPNLKLSDAEIRAWLADARRYVKGEQKTEYSSNQLESVDVHVSVLNQDTGRMFKVKEKASKAISDLDAQMEQYFKILECVGGAA